MLLTLGIGRKQSYHLLPKLNDADDLKGREAGFWKWNGEEHVW
jgi:hypothetical protein